MLASSHALSGVGEVFSQNFFFLRLMPAGTLGVFFHWIREERFSRSHGEHGGIKNNILNQFRF